MSITMFNLVSNFTFNLIFNYQMLHFCLKFDVMIWNYKNFN